ILYTTWGGVKSVNYSDFQQMLIITAGMVAAFVATIALLPRGVSFSDALHVAGGMGKLRLIDFSFDFDNRYNIWSGIFGGMFVALAYFGTDQSQVQRYLTGQSVAHSRLALLFNGVAKVPMQFFILLIGAMVFVFYQFSTPPIFFNPVEDAKIRASAYGSEYAALEGKYGDAFREKSKALQSYLEAEKSGDSRRIAEAGEQLREADRQTDQIRASALQVLKKNDSSVDTNDTNYIFLSFVMKYLPVGLVGLIFACIFAASMSSSSGELSALATCSVVDVYKRHFKKDGTDRHYLTVSRVSMALWGVYGIVFAQYASRLGSLVEAVNILGSLFYGTMLGIFLLAFYFKRVRGTATFIAAFVGEAVVLSCFQFTQIAWLWYNVIGCGVLVVVALIINPFLPSHTADKKAPSVAR
ncbi:MAG TPA: sodium:solute symporter, partial [Bacteroidota bacterium]|nr:sodium:solute symporter [Bacteroidota bacterium]